MTNAGSRHENTWLANLVAAAALRLKKKSVLILNTETNFYALAMSVAHVEEEADNQHQRRRDSLDAENRIKSVDAQRRCVSGRVEAVL